MNLKVAISIQGTKIAVVVFRTAPSDCIKILQSLIPHVDERAVSIRVDSDKQPRHT